MAEQFSVPEDFNTVSNDINVHVGRRVLARRRMLRISQDELGRACGISAQQVWKYENGISGMSAARLVSFGQQLRVPISWFFEDFESHPDMPEDIVDLLRDPRALTLLRSFGEIPAESCQQVVLDLAESLATVVHDLEPEQGADVEELEDGQERLSA